MRLDPDEKLKLDGQNSIVLNFLLHYQRQKLKIPTKSKVDRRLNDRRIIRNTTHVDFNDKNLVKVRFVKVNSMPAVREHLIPKY